MRRILIFLFLVAYPEDRAVAVRAVVVPLGSARVRYHRRRGLVDRAANPAGIRPVDLCTA